MATFIPPAILDETPWSERQVYNEIAKDSIAKDWTVFHSLGLGAHEKRPHGEIDFVVIVPDLGIVTIEVKGGTISCHDGKWTTTPTGSTRAKPLDRSPWMQARKNSYELERYLKTRLSGDEDTKLNFSFLVVLPNTRTVPVSPEFNRWELATEEDLYDLGIGRCIVRSLQRTIGATGAPVGLSRPANGLMRRVRRLLRPDFDLVATPSSIIREGESRLLRLTEEQYRLLDVAEANRRTLAIGAAGTGKTLLALEFAKREYLNGRRVGLFCFNRLLGDWVSGAVHDFKASTAAPERASLAAGTIHSWLLSLINSTPELKGDFASSLAPDKERFGELVFYYGELSLLQKGIQFDCVVIDEIQDFLETPLLDILDQALEGGISGGSWLLLGDFTRQSLYSSDASPRKEENFRKRIEEYGAYPTTVPLTLNCRNTKRIARHTIDLSGFDKDPFRISEHDGLPVEVFFYKERRELCQRVEAAFREFVSDGIPTEQIVLLGNASGDGSHESVIADMQTWSTLKVAEWTDTPKEGELRFASTRRFKGMECMAAIVTDISDLSSDRARSLIYVAMSRARTRLRVLLPDELKPSFDARLSAAIERSLST